MPVTDTLLSLNISSSESEAECKPYPLDGDQVITFHGYNALSFNSLEEYPDEEVPENSWTHETIITQWGMYKGGRCHILKTQIEISTPGLPGPSQDYPIADVLWSLAENSLPFTGGNFDSPEQPPQPADPEEIVPGQPEVPTDQTVIPIETDALFDIPLAVVLGSLGIPVAGALAGAVLSAILSGSSAVAGTAAGSTAVTVMPTPASSGIPTSGGEGIPTAGGEGTSPDGAESTEVEDHISAAKFDFLNHDFESINQDLLDKKTYVLNPHQGDPTLIVHKVNTGFNIVWDKTVGQLTGDQGLTCEGYVKKTRKQVNDAVFKRFPDAIVQEIVFEEISSVKDKKTWGEWLDSFNPDTHILNKIILPDGSEWAVDFHQYNAGNSPLIRPWSETHRAWKEEYMGDEFSERIRRITKKDD